ncbi:hypothetical protein U9M48_005735 [Paspalum notatum var. saurae]|uniref:Uncharacterized protein n=1 Tax=Paspalum notatum var. saurae TaxID=547442 RepID=A0AAQ3PRI9_PASNO
MLRRAPRGIEIRRGGAARSGSDGTPPELRASTREEGAREGAAPRWQRDLAAVPPHPVAPLTIPRSGLFIGGGWREPSLGRRLPVVNLAPEATIGSSGPSSSSSSPLSPNRPDSILLAQCATPAMLCWELSLIQAIFSLLGVQVCFSSKSVIVEFGMSIPAVWHVCLSAAA